MVKQKLNITFHNPNSNDEVAKLLVKIIAQQKVDDLINNKLNIPKSQATVVTSEGTQFRAAQH